MEKVQFAKYEKIIREYVGKHYLDTLCEPVGILKHKFIVPGSGYAGSLWDWDSWFVDMALKSIVKDRDISEYEKGCILNFLDHTDEQGRMPVFIMTTAARPKFVDGEKSNTHKPILAQHALFVCEKLQDYSWLAGKLEIFERYISYYERNAKHESGLFYWIDDHAIGVDNDPCTFYRPRCSSASILLNCFMYKEFLALAELSKRLDEDKTAYYLAKAEELKGAIQEHCWDERDGFFYSVDINLLPIDPNQNLHKGAPRHYNNLIQRIGVWSGFLAMWAGIATKEQADRMVKEHFLNDKTFACDYGIRSLSKMEKMYAILSTNNPSCWLGPVWVLCNYVCFVGLKAYGYIEEAKSIAERTVLLLGKDVEETGEFHEFYDPESGKTVHHLGFQSWNMFVVEMIDWLKENGREG